MIRMYLFRWWRHWQLDVGWRDRGWLSIGLEWRNGLRPILYLSPDATPQRATFSINRGAEMTQTAETISARCGEPGCTNTPDSRCDGPTGAGCGEMFCGDHLFATERDGYLCSADYDCIEDRVADEDAQP